MTSARCRSCSDTRMSAPTQIYTHVMSKPGLGRTQPARRLDAPAFASLQRGKEAGDWGEESAGMRAVEG